MTNTDPRQRLHALVTDMKVPPSVRWVAERLERARVEVNLAEPAKIFGLLEAVEAFRRGEIVAPRLVATALEAIRRLPDPYGRPPPGVTSLEELLAEATRDAELLEAFRTPTPEQSEQA